jgi:hypothetical protein
MAKPYGILDDFWRKTMALIHHCGRFHTRILTDINWIGIAPTATDFGKALEWLTGTAEGAAFGVLYNSVYTCENSFATYITASSN